MGGDLPDLEVIGLGAVVVEGRFCAHPDFVFSTGVGGVIVAAGGVPSLGAKGAIDQNCTELITTLHDATADHKRRVIS